jgi:hypothetical protein
LQTIRCVAFLSLAPTGCRRPAWRTPGLTAIERQIGREREIIRARVREPRRRSDNVGRVAGIDGDRTFAAGVVDARVEGHLSIAEHVQPFEYDCDPCVRPVLPQTARRPGFAERSPLPPRKPGGDNKDRNRCQRQAPFEAAAVIVPLEASGPLDPVGRDERRREKDHRHDGGQQFQSETVFGVQVMANPPFIQPINLILK